MATLTDLARVRGGRYFEKVAVDAAEGDLAAALHLPRGRQVFLGYIEVGGLRNLHVVEAKQGALCCCKRNARVFILIPKGVILKVKAFTCRRWWSAITFC